VAALHERISNVISFKYSEKYMRFHDDGEAQCDSLVMIPRLLMKLFKRMASHFRRLT